MKRVSMSHLSVDSSSSIMEDQNGEIVNNQMQKRRKVRQKPTWSLSLQKQKRRPTFIHSLKNTYDPRKIKNVIKLLTTFLPALQGTQNHNWLWVNSWLKIVQALFLIFDCILGRKICKLDTNIPFTHSCTVWQRLITDLKKIQRMYEVIVFQYFGCWNREKWIGKKFQPEA